jgi:hypothetical protein
MASPQPQPMQQNPQPAGQGQTTSPTTDAQMAQSLGIDVNAVNWGQMIKVLQFILNLLQGGGPVMQSAAQCPADDSKECCKQSACHSLMAAQICLNHVHDCETKAKAGKP